MGNVRTSRRSLITPVLVTLLVFLCLPLAACRRSAPPTAEEWAYRGYGYEQTGDYEKAVSCYTKAIGLDPKGFGFYRLRADAYASLREYDRAIRDYGTVIELCNAAGPIVTLMYNNRGACYDRLGEYELAVEEYTDAIANDPAFAETYLNRADSYNSLGAYSMAIADYGRAIELRPEYAPAYLKRGRVHEAHGMVYRARCDYDAACAYGEQAGCGAAARIDAGR